MYLVIAEKPSVSRAIAEVIGAQEREDGYLQGTDCMVSWCFGHLAEYVSPDAYDEKFNQWRYEDLPIIPKGREHVLQPPPLKKFIYFSFSSKSSSSDSSSSGTSSSPPVSKPSG